MVSTLPSRGFDAVMSAGSATRIGCCITSGIKPVLPLLLFALPRSLYSVEINAPTFLSRKRLSVLEESQCGFAPTERRGVLFRAATAFIICQDAARVRNFQNLRF